MHQDFACQSLFFIIGQEKLEDAGMSDLYGHLFRLQDASGEGLIEMNYGIRSMPI